MARFVGTGKSDRYPKGVIVDIPDTGEGREGAVNQSQLTLVEDGLVKPLAPADDPAREVQALAHGAQRGDFAPGNMNDPVDVALAAKHGFIDKNGNPTEAAYNATHEVDSFPDEDKLSKVGHAAEATGIKPAKGTLTADD